MFFHIGRAQLTGTRSASPACLIAGRTSSCLSPWLHGRGLVVLSEGKSEEGKAHLQGSHSRPAKARKAGKRPQGIGGGSLSAFEAMPEIAVQYMRHSFTLSLSLSLSQADGLNVEVDTQSSNHFRKVLTAGFGSLGKLGRAYGGGVLGHRGMLHQASAAFCCNRWQSTKVFAVPSADG